MGNLSFFKKISLYLSYRKTLKNLKKDLELELNLRVDNVDRIYTVLNIPESVFEEPYNIRKSDIDTISKNFIQDYTRQISRFLDQNGLIELYDFYEVEKVGKYSYLLVLGFRFFNTQTFFSRIYYIFLPTIILTTCISLYLFFR